MAANSPSYALWVSAQAEALAVEQELHRALHIEAADRSHTFPEQRTSYAIQARAKASATLSATIHELTWQAPPGPLATDSSAIQHVTVLLGIWRLADLAARTAEESASCSRCNAENGSAPGMRIAMKGLAIELRRQADAIFRRTVHVGPKVGTPAIAGGGGRSLTSRAGEIWARSSGR